MRLANLVGCVAVFIICRLHLCDLWSLQDPTKRVARAVLSIGRLFSAEAQERDMGKTRPKTRRFSGHVGL